MECGVKACGWQGGDLVGHWFQRHGTLPQWRARPDLEFEPYRIVDEVRYPTVRDARGRFVKVTA